MRPDIVRKLSVVYNNLRLNADIVFISEDVDWIIKEICKTVQHHIRAKHELKAELSYTPFFLKHSILHFGSIGTLATNKTIRKIHPSNRIIVTWFHVEPDDARVKHIPELNKKVTYLHTANQTTKRRLVELGFDEKKIVVIPLGVDVQTFRLRSQEDYVKARQELAIPEDVFVIGSFQKDGEGWGEGMNPKLVKGPDVFCDVVESVARKRPVHVLLTGPARGYVKMRLEKAQIPYTHRMAHGEKIVPCYHALDAYVIASRVEGGPMALLESWACGVPLITTRMGMPADIVVHEKNALIADVEDTGKLAAFVEEIANNKEKAHNMAKQAVQDVQAYDWNSIAEQYYDRLYKPLL